MDDNMLIEHRVSKNPERWESIEFELLKKDDIFRMRDPDTKKIYEAGPDKTTVFRANSDAYWDDVMQQYVIHIDFLSGGSSEY